MSAPRERSDRDPAVYARLRARQERARAALERERFDPAPPGDDDWTVADRDGLRRLPTVPTPISEVLAQVTGDRRWGERLQGAMLIDRWEDIVGADVAGHCRPRRLAGGVLTVEAFSPSWATQLRYLSSRLALAVNKALAEPLVTEVVIVVGRDA